MTPVVGLSERFQMVKYPDVVLQLHPVVCMYHCLYKGPEHEGVTLVLASYSHPCHSLGLLFAACSPVFDCRGPDSGLADKSECHYMLYFAGSIRLCLFVPRLLIAAQGLSI